MLLNVSKCCLNVSDDLAGLFQGELKVKVTVVRPGPHHLRNIQECLYTEMVGRSLGMALNSGKVS